MASVTAPVADFTGTVAGVEFVDGKADTTSPAALAYFRRHGYTIDQVTQAETLEATDPRTVGTDGDGIEHLGTPLRDAAVDPEPGDYLPPTNAGEANPHGPEVVSPEIHGSQGVRPVKPGKVPVDAPEVQEAAETAHAAEFTDVVDEVERPAQSAPKAEWVAYAVAQGATEADLADATKADLIDRYGD